MRGENFRFSEFNTGTFVTFPPHASPDPLACNPVFAIHIALLLIFRKPFFLHNHLVERVLGKDEVASSNLP